MPDEARIQIRLRRAYDAPARSDGHRVLVDRVWPRGVSRNELRLDGWLKDLAPSAGLRKWFNHEPEKWDAFKRRYFSELDERPDMVEHLLETCRQGVVTLVFGAKDIRHNNAAALKEYLETRVRR